jgi:hypothetical protein
VYYLDLDYVIQEFRFVEGKGWSEGDVGNLKIKATPGAGLAAVVYLTGNTPGSRPDDHIHVYYQGEYLPSAAG